MPVFMMLGRVVTLYIYLQPSAPISLPKLAFGATTSKASFCIASCIFVIDTDISFTWLGKHCVSTPLSFIS